VKPQLTSEDKYEQVKKTCLLEHFSRIRAETKTKMWG